MSDLEDRGTFWDGLDKFLGTNQMQGAMAGCVAALLVDRESVVVAVTNLGAELFGYSPGEIIGVHINDLMAEEFRSRHEQFVDQYWQNPKTLQMGLRKIPGLKKNGTAFSATFWLKPVPGKESELVFVQLFA